MVSPAPAAPSAQLLRQVALLVALSATLSPVARLEAQAGRVVGPVTFEGKEWLGVEADDLELDEFDGSDVPRISFAFTNEGADEGAASIRVGPEDAAYVQGQGLEGPTDSILTIEFAQPIVGFQAGMAFLSNRAEQLAVRLEASDDEGVSVLARNYSSSIASATLFPGTLVKADFEGQVTRVRLRVVSKARRFFLDNLVLTFEGTGLPTVEPPAATVFEGRAPKAKMIRLAHSGSVAAWPEDGVIRFQMVSANGRPEGPIRAATATGQTGWAPAITPYDGGFALLWYGRESTASGSPEGVFLKLHAADGSPTDVRGRIFSPDTRRATRITLGAVEVGRRLIVTWDDGEKSGAMRYDPDDKTLVPISLPAPSSDCGLHAVSFAARNALLWCSDELWAQFYDARNEPTGDPISLSDGLAGSPISVHVAAMHGGSRHARALAWAQDEGEGTTAVYVRTLNTEGALSPAVRVSPTLARGSSPAIAGHSDGSFLVAWLAPFRPGSAELPRTLWAQVFFATGAAATDPLRPISELNADPESIVLTWDGRRATLLWENSVSSATLPGSYLSVFEAEPERSPCRASSTSLCLQQNRFEVTVQYRDFDGVVGSGRPAGLTSDTGYFWFFEQGAADLVVKVLDGRSTNGHHWVFFGSLTNVAFDLMVEDRLTGQTSTYSNELGSFASAGDTRAFESFGSTLVSDAPAQAAASSWSREDLGLAGDRPTANEDPSLCLEAAQSSPLGACLASRFLVEVEWEDFGGAIGDGHGQAISDDTASFWFFDAANLELVVKVLDGSSINDHFWVFFGSLTNVAFDLTVTDLQTGFMRTWSNPGGVFASQGDTSALPAD